MGTAAIVGGSVAAAVIGGVASYAGGKAQADAAEEAAELQARSQQTALQFQQQQYDEAKERMNPFIAGSEGAFQEQQALSGALGAEAQQGAYDRFVESPGVAFQRQQGENALNRQAAASGGFGGASRLKAMSEFNQGLAEQSINNRFNQLGAITGTGLGAAQALSGVGSATGAGMAQTAQTGAAAQANALTQGANAMAQGYQGIGQNMQSGLGFLGGYLQNSGGAGGSTGMDAMAGAGLGASGGMSYGGQ